jgi:hypothetical protein
LGLALVIDAANVRYRPIADVRPHVNIVVVTHFFWRLAFRLYNRRKPSAIFEVLALGFGAFFVLMFSLAVYLNPVFENVLRLFVAVCIVSAGMAHRRVRLERDKAPDALYRKMLATKD